MYVYIFYVILSSHIDTSVALQIQIMSRLQKNQYTKLIEPPIDHYKTVTHPQWARCASESRYVIKGLAVACVFVPFQCFAKNIKQERNLIALALGFVDPIHSYSNRLIGIPKNSYKTDNSKYKMFIRQVAAKSSFTCHYF